MNHIHDTKALELSREVMEIMYGPMPVGGSVQLQAKIQCLFADAMEFAVSNSPAIPDGWIPVSERLPLTPSADCEYSDIEVNVFDGERVSTARYAIGSRPQPWGVWADTYANITHWQPLPAAPKVTP